jgi:hypothetical protein
MAILTLRSSGSLRSLRINLRACRAKYAPSTGHKEITGNEDILSRLMSFAYSEPLRNFTRRTIGSQHINQHNGLLWHDRHDLANKHALNAEKSAA